MPDNKTTVYLIPNTLGDAPLQRSIPDFNLEVIRGLKFFAVESEKSARKFLKSCGVMPPFEGINFFVLDKRTRPAELNTIFQSAGSHDIGILSDAGCPAVADPGSNLVLAAYKKGLDVIPLVGPSSILLAIMASGMNGQGFTFHGYLPVNGSEKMQKLREIEAISSQTGHAQLFIETPFRNMHLFDDVIKTCRQNTLLSIACDLTLATQEIKTYTIQEWRGKNMPLKNRQVVFSISGARVKKLK